MGTKKRLIVVGVISCPDLLCSENVKKLKRWRTWITKTMKKILEPPLCLPSQTSILLKIFNGCIKSLNTFDSTFARHSVEVPCPA